MHTKIGPDLIPNPFAIYYQPRGTMCKNRDEEDLMLTLREPQMNASVGSGHRRAPLVIGERHWIRPGGDPGRGRSCTPLHARPFVRWPAQEEAGAAQSRPGAEAVSGGAAQSREWAGAAPVQRSWRGGAAQSLEGAGVEPVQQSWRGGGAAPVSSRSRTETNQRIEAASRLG